MSRKAPELNPPVDGWWWDLPKPNEPASEKPAVEFGTVNALTDTYLELGVCAPISRGIALYMYSFCALSMLAGLALILPVSHFNSGDFYMNLLLLGLCALFIFMVKTFLRLNAKAPRDAPIRFNHGRQKLYVYGRMFTGADLHDKEGWTKARCYDWSQIRAEYWSRSKASGVSLAAVHPNTNKVIERFELETGVGFSGQRTRAWAYVCTYMQGGHKALPPFYSHELRDQRIGFWNVALKLAPPVEWPPQMDIESRTAPD